MSSVTNPSQGVRNLSAIPHEQKQDRDSCFLNETDLIRIPPFPLLEFPPEVRQYILSLLPIKELVRTSQASKNLATEIYGTTAFVRRILFQKAKTTADFVLKLTTRVYCLVQIAKAQAATGDFMRAKDTFESAVDIANLISGTDYKKAKALGKIAKAQAASKDIIGAKATADLIQDAEWKGDALFEIVKVQLANGGLTGDQAADLFQNPEEKAFILIKIAKEQAANNDIEGAKDSLGKAREQAERIQMADYKLPGLMIVAEAQTAIKDVNGANTTLAIAKETAVRMIDDAENSKTTYLFEIVKAQAANGDIDRAKATAELIQDEWKDSAFIEIAKALAACDQTSEAGKTAELIQDLEGKVRAWVGIAKAQAANNNRSDSNASLTNARETAKLIDSGWKAHSLVDIAKAQAANGDIDRAKATVELIIKDNINNMKILGLIEIAKIQAANNNIPGAKDTFKTARAIAELLPEEDTSKGPSLVDIARAQAWNGDIIGSRVTAELIHKVYYVDALLSIATAQTEHNDFRGAKDTLAKARTKAKLLWEGDYRKVIKLVDIAAAQTANNYFEEASISLAEAATEANLYDKEDISDVLRLRIAEAQVANNDLTGAMATADLIRKVPALRVRVLVGIAKEIKLLA